MFREQLSSDLGIRLPWSGARAGNALKHREFCRLVRAFEVSRWIGKKTVLIMDKSARWLVTADYCGYWNVTWRMV